MSASFYDLLKFAKTGVASPSMTAYDKQKALAMCKAGFPVKTLTGVPPIPFDSDGTPLIAWTVVGNEQQTGTPTPTVPITPEECGEKTGNLFDTSTDVNDGYIDNAYLRPDGSVSREQSQWYVSCYIKVIAGETYTYTPNHAVPTNPSICYYDDTKTYVATLGAAYGRTFTVPSGVSFVRFSVNKSGYNIMLNTGNTALPYEPFGYKIPITLAGQTHNIYLSEPLRKIGDYGDTVEQDGTVTRRIKKLELTGIEDWQLHSSGNGLFTLSTADYLKVLNIDMEICSHYKSINSVGNYATVGDCETAFYGGTAVAKVLYIKDTDFETATNFKTFLADEYAAGHPVTVWYVLANSVTETVTVPTLTPTKGSNTLSIGTTLQPSEVSITGGIK